MAGFYTFPDHIDGDTLQFVIFRFFLTDDIEGNEEDLTGCSAKMVWRRGSMRGKVVKTIEVGAGFTWLDITNGELIMDSFVFDFGVSEYYYDLQITYPDNSIVTKIQGKMKVKPQSTL